MNKEIITEYEFINKNSVEVKVKEVYKNAVEIKKNNYYLPTFDTSNEVELYNKLLDDFDAEFDDDLAFSIMRMSNSIINTYNERWEENE